MTPWETSNIRALLAAVRDPAWADEVRRKIHVNARLQSDPLGVVSRAELAQALNMVLFDDLVERVPSAASYVP